MLGLIAITIFIKINNNYYDYYDYYIVKNIYVNTQYKRSSQETLLGNAF